MAAARARTIRARAAGRENGRTRKELAGQMTNATLTLNSTDGLRGGAEERTGSGPGPPASGRVWIAGLVGVVGTLILASLLSPGLRSDLDGIADLLGSINPVAVKDWVLSFGAWAPLAYFLAMTAQAILIPIPSSPVTLAGALVFGAPTGLALSMMGSTVGSALVFLAVRRWGEPLVVRLVGKETFRRYSGKLDERGWWLFLVLLVPFTPDDVVCALAGLTRISFRRFLILMVLGRLPATAATVLLASGVATGSTVVLVTAGSAVLALMALGLAYRKRLESWTLGRSESGPAHHGSDAVPEGVTR